CRRGLQEALLAKSLKLKICKKKNANYAQAFLQKSRNADLRRKISCKNGKSSDLHEIASVGAICPA
ncbi:MAG: hypothetical protein PUF49_09880, partial [Firmicutes bacterium]|nr:hypothetical protein [Bacillota bacterium]